nr:MBG domain-containing protein [Paenibacillus sp. DCT19]
MDYPLDLIPDNYTITASFAGYQTYLPSNGTSMLNVNKRPLTLLAADATRMYGASNPVFTGTMTGTRAQDGITAKYGTMAGESSIVGTYPIEATLNDPNGKLSNYNVTLSPGTLTIEQAPLNVTADNARRLYGASNPVFTGTLTGVLHQDGITATYETTAGESSNVGTYPIEATLNDPNGKLSNYDVTLSPGTLTIEQAPLSAIADGARRLYGASNPAFTGTMTGVRDEDGITATYGTAADSASDTGTYPIEASLNDPNGKLDNYDVTLSPGTLTIEQAPLSATADDARRVYGASNPVFTGTLTGVLHQDGITATYDTTAGESSNVGTYPIEATLNDPNGKLDNYDVTLTPGTLTIEQAPLSATADDARRVYGASNPVFTGTLTGVLHQDGITATYGTTAGESSNVGTYPIEATLNDPNGKLDNYDVTLTPSTLTIEQAPLSVTVDAVARWSNYDNPVLTGKLIGAVATDNLSVIYKTFADKNSPVGTYEVEAELIDPEGQLSNYDVTVYSAELVVYAAPYPVYSTGDSAETVTRDIELASMDEKGRPITWRSSDTRFLDPATGQIQRPVFLEGNAEIMLSASVEAYGTVYEAAYELMIYAADMTDETAVELDAQNLRIGYADGDSATSVQGRLSLETRGANGTTISWTSSMPSLIDPMTGLVRRPSYSTGDQTVTMKATVTKGDTSLEVEFHVKVIRSNNTGTGGGFVNPEPEPQIEPEKETSTPPYMDIETPRGVKRIELTKDKDVSNIIRVAVGEEDVQFTIENRVLERLKSLHPDMTLIITTRLTNFTIHLSKLEINQADDRLRISVRHINKMPKLASAIAEQKAKVMAGAVQTDISVLHANGQHAETSPYARFVEQRIRLGNVTGFDNASVVRWDEERGELRHVLARFTSENGETVAIIQNSGTGIYLVMERSVSFADMQNHWGREDVEKLASKLIVQGRGSDRFEPNGRLTRAEATALLNRALGIFTSSSVSTFSDVQGQWYAVDVMTAYQSGHIAGYNDGTFRPNESITREELAVIITRALAFVGDNAYKQPARDWQPVDEDNISVWAKEAVNQAIRLNILNGDEQGHVRPHAATTRAEMAVMLSRMLQTIDRN